MRDTYSKLNYHLVFSTKNRIPLITDALRDPLYGYIGGILSPTSTVPPPEGGGNGPPTWNPRSQVTDSRC
jgi:putative transposase